MSKSFSVNFTGDPAPLFERARKAAADNGAQITGDTNKGSFSGRGVEGNYTVSGNTVNITVDKKPVIIPWPLVESQLKQFFQ
jgi:hypothetical protein